MRGKKDSGVSVVIAFVIILAIIAIASGMWALFGIPAQIREANEVQTIEVADSLTDYKVMLENLHNPGFEGVTLSTLIPLGSSYSSGVMTLKGNVGKIKVSKSDNTYDSDSKTEKRGTDIVLWEQDVNRLSMTIGNHGTEVGYEGGGIYRNDNGNYAWIVYPSFSIFKSSGTDYLLRLGAVSNIEGDFSIGGSGDIAINTKYKEYNKGMNGYSNEGDETKGGTIKSMIVTDENTNQKTSIENYFTVTYTSASSDLNDLALWYSLFYETKYSASSELSGIFEADLPVLNLEDYIVSMKIKVVPSESERSATAYLYGYTYEADLVPDTLVREAEVPWSAIMGVLKKPYESVYMWSEYTSEDIAKGYIFFDRPLGDYYIALSPTDKGESGSARSFYLSNKDKMAVIDRTVSHILSDEDTNGNLWKEGVNPRAGSLYYKDGKLYVCVRSIVGNPGTDISDEDWTKLGDVNEDKYKALISEYA